MKSGEVIFNFLVPADEDCPKAIEPTMGSFNHPTPGTLSRFPVEFTLLFAPTSDVSSVAVERRDQLSHRRGIVGFVQTQLLFVAVDIACTLNAILIVS